MIAFAGAAFFLLVAALLFLLWPLLRRSNPALVGRELSNLDIHRDQVSELEQDLQAGTLGADRYEQAKSELHRRILEEAAAPAVVQRSASTGKSAAIVIGILVPLTAALLYLYLGNLQGLVAPRHSATDPSSITADQFQDMTAKLASRMQQNPGDAQGWKMLGRAYRAASSRGS